MRGHLEILKDIENHLSNTNQERASQELEHEVQGSATGSELLLRVGFWLVSNKKATGLGKLKNEWLVCCRLNGLEVKNQYDDQEDEYPKMTPCWKFW